MTKLHAERVAALQPSAGSISLAVPDAPEL